MRITIPGSSLAVLLLLQASAQAADIAAGEAAYNARGCVGCHGVAGMEPIGPNYPVLGGKPEAFIVGELERFRAGGRHDPAMSTMASNLSDAEIADIAAYLAAQ